MKIAVCIKRVPDSEARIRIGDDGKSIDADGVKFVVNPYDEYAIEEALRLRDTHGGEVVALSLGSEPCKETIRHALAMGADRGILLETGAPGGDSLATGVDPLSAARALAAELRDGGYDLILFGKLSIDDGSHAVGTMVAELLDLPSTSAISRLEIEGGTARAERDIEGGTEVVELPLPAVLTAEKGLNEPRRPALRGIMLAKKKPIETRPATLESGGVEIVSLTLPPERKPGRIVGHGADAVPALLDALRGEAKVL